MSRKPLKPLDPALRIKLLHHLGYDLIIDNGLEIIVPLVRTPAETAAYIKAAHEDKKIMEPEVPAPQPLIPPKVAMILAAIGSFLGLAASAASGIASLPVWAPFALSILGAICLFLAGKAIPALKLPGGALLPPKMVPLFGALATALGTFAAQLQPGMLQGALLLLASIVAGLAGVAAPQALKK
jgi:hypothetical protein